MRFTADAFTFSNNNYKLPQMTLHNPDGEELTSLSLIKNLVITPRFNTISEMSFVIYEKLNSHGEERVFEHYNSLTKSKLINIIGIGWWIIDKADETFNGTTPYKTVYCLSYEHTLNSKNINLSKDTYKFYDPIEPNETLLGNILASLPSWSIGHIDSDLWNKYRYFDVQGCTVYSFLANNVERAYECIIDFDIANKTINAYTPQNVIKPTDIVFTFDNLLKEVQINETDDNIITALSVQGGGDMDIRYVNPLGGNVIYNFDYYKKKNDDGTEWMSDNLIESINKWEDKIEVHKKEYGNLLAELKTQKGELLKLQNELDLLNGDLKALEDQRTAQIQAGQSTYQTTIEWNNKENEINNKKFEIANKEKEIEVINDNLSKINKDLKFENNFTKDELIKLDVFVCEGSFTNENCIKTDRLTPIQIQEISEQLYEQGKEQLKKYSQPLYTLSLKAANFLLIEQFQDFISQLQLGCTVDAEVKKGFWVRPLLLEFTLDYDNPNNLNLVFGDKFRISGKQWDTNDSLRETKQVSLSVVSQLPTINSKQNVVDSVSQYMKNDLDTSLQEIKNTKGQAPSLGDYGIWAKKISDTGLVDPCQLRITNNQIVMTKDGWESVVSAFGKINGYYGLNAEIIMGKLIAGNQLKITNENNSFTVDSDGATLYNAVLTILRKDKKAQIVLNPDDGFKIQTKSGSSWKDSFYVDYSGRLVAEDIVSKSGTIGGWNITSNGLESSYGDYLRSDGTGRIGLLSYTPYSATFDGNIYARNLVDQVQEDKLGDEAVSTNKIKDYAVTNAKISNLSADKITTGTLDASSISVRNLSADSITTGTLRGSQVLITGLCADYITTGKLSADRIDVNELVVRGNLVAKNGTFSGDINWGNGLGSISWNPFTTGVSLVGERGLELIANSGDINLSANNIYVRGSLVVGEGSGGLKVGDSWAFWKLITYVNNSGGKSSTWVLSRS